MENFRKDPRIFIAQVFAAGMLVIYLLMLTLDARGQSSSKPVFSDRATSLHSAHQINRVKQIYTSQIGVRESQPNAGKEVEKYLRYVNLPKGNPWCAAFVCWVYGEAGVRSLRSGWVPELFGESRIIWEQGTRSKEQGHPPNVPFDYASKLVRSKRLPAYRTGKLVTPRAADIFGLYFPEKGRIAHVGFIDEWKDPWVVTVEGNTNVLGSREGDGVYRKRRLVRSVYKVARYVW